MKLRVVPSALSLILSGGIPGLIAVTPAPAAAARSAYAMTDLGNLEGTITDRGMLGSTQSAAYAINDNGQIVASSSNAQGQEHAFLLTQLVSAPRIYRPPA
jgi:probable HAF family extracellular repeat protein